MAGFFGTRKYDEGKLATPQQISQKTAPVSAVADKTGAENGYWDINALFDWDKFMKQYGITQEDPDYQQTIPTYNEIYSGFKSSPAYNEGTSFGDYLQSPEIQAQIRKGLAPYTAPTNWGSIYQSQQAQQAPNIPASLPAAQTITGPAKPKEKQSIWSAVEGGGYVPVDTSESEFAPEIKGITGDLLEQARDLITGGDYENAWNLVETQRRDEQAKSEEAQRAKFGEQLRAAGITDERQAAGLWSQLENQLNQEGRELSQALATGKIDYINTLKTNDFNKAMDILGFATGERKYEEIEKPSAMANINQIFSNIALNDKGIEKMDTEIKNMILTGKLTEAQTRETIASAIRIEQLTPVEIDKLKSEIGLTDSQMEALMETSYSGINELVKNGTITQEQADKLITALDTKVDSLVQGTEIAYGDYVLRSLGVTMDGLTTMLGVTGIDNWPPAMVADMMAWAIDGMQSGKPMDQWDVFELSLDTQFAIDPVAALSNPNNQGQTLTDVDGNTYTITDGNLADKDGNIVDINDIDFAGGGGGGDEESKVGDIKGNQEYTDDGWVTHEPAEYDEENKKFWKEGTGWTDYNNLSTTEKTTVKNLILENPEIWTKLSDFVSYNDLTPAAKNAVDNGSGTVNTPMYFDTVNRISAGRNWGVNDGTNWKTFGEGKFIYFEPTLGNVNMETNNKGTITIPPGKYITVSTDNGAVKYYVKIKDDGKYDINNIYTAEWDGKIPTTYSLEITMGGNRANEFFNKLKNFGVF